MVRILGSRPRMTMTECGAPWVTRDTVLAVRDGLSLGVDNGSLLEANENDFGIVRRSLDVDDA